jgi:rSAM/selenodomain-associated transferase 2
VKIAVVIPALNEAAAICGAVRSATAPGIELIVVDGGSVDETRSFAQSAGARVLLSEPGRGRQLQAGVAATKGDPVVLLHADSRLPTGWVEAVRAAVALPGTAGGAFRLSFEESTPMLQVIEWGVRLRVAIFGLPYGDQAIFVRRHVLEAIGGIPDVPVMEDLDLVKAVKRQGRLVNLGLPVVTSGRRYLEGGAARTVALHTLAVAGWLAGVRRDRVAEWLRR